LSIEDAKNGVQQMIDLYYATGDLMYMAQANRYATAGNAAYELAQAQKSSASACKSAAEESRRAAEEWKDTIVDIAGLRAEWIGGAKGAKLYLDAVIARTGLTGINNANFLAKFTEASKNGLSTEDFNKWSDLSSAIKDYASALDDAQQEAYNRQIEMLNKQLDFYTDILDRINKAYTGALSYLNTIEKANYIGDYAMQQLENGNTQGYFDSLYKQLEHEKRLSTTREDYS